MDNNTRKLLHLTDKSLIFEENWLSLEVRDGKAVNRIMSRLTYKDKQCPQCGFSSHTIKNGTYQTISQLPNLYGKPTYLKLRRERYLCKKCDSTFSAQTSLVDDYCHISKQLKSQIAIDLKENRSRKEIAQYNHVSENTVERVLRSFTDRCRPNFQFLPMTLCVDEFRSHAKTQDKMSFICADGKIGKLVDVFLSRKFAYLNKHFNRYYTNELKKVQFIVTDMNAAYFKLAEIIVDRFHVISHMNKVFNEFRIRENKELIKSKEKKKAGKLKTNWKLLLKNQQTIN